MLGLQGDVREHMVALDRCGAAPVLVRRPRELVGLEGLVIPGGESTTIDTLLGIFELREPLREAIGNGLPVYGSCAGMILLADRVLDGTVDQQTLGGIDMTVRRNAFGRQVDSFEAAVTVNGIEGGPLAAVFIRAPWVESLGPAASAIATVSDGSSAGRIVAVRQGSLLATSFHPEITGDTRVHELFVSIVHKER